MLPLFTAFHLVLSISFVFYSYTFLSSLSFLFFFIFKEKQDFKFRPCIQETKIYKYIHFQCILQIANKLERVDDIKTLFKFSIFHCQCLSGRSNFKTYVLRR